MEKMILKEVLLTMPDGTSVHIERMEVQRDSDKKTQSPFNIDVVVKYATIIGGLVKLISLLANSV